MTLSKKLAVLIIFLMLFSNISIAAKPDIYIKNVEIPSGKIYDGDEVPVNFTVANNGDETVSFEVAMFVDDRNKIVDSINVTLNAGESKRETLYWLAEEGNHTIFIFADYNNMVNEESEDNNLASIEIHVMKPEYARFPPEANKATWWDEKWHYRVPLSVSMFGKRSDYVYQNKMVYCNLNFTKLMDIIAGIQTGSFSKRTFNPDSVRVIEYENDNGTWHPLRSVGREIVLLPDYDPVKNANVTLIWVMEGALKPHERRYYYIYWDTKENGRKNGEYGNIYSGIKNCDFEGNEAWRNTTEGNIKWDIGYTDDPLEKDRCYRIHAKGLYGFGRAWIKDYYAKVTQSIKVPDEGQSNYIFHGKVYVASDIDIFEWEIAIDNNVIASGRINSGWNEITRNVTSYLHGKASALVSFTLKITQTQIYKDAHEVNAYIDSFWIESENLESKIYENYSSGWDGSVDVEKEFVAGVKGKNSIEKIEVKTLADPKEVVAKLYSPYQKVVKATIPFPDPSFEWSYTATFVSDEKTGNAEIKSGVSHSGSKSVLLKLSNYIGKFKIENENVKEKDSAGFRQNITYQIPLSYIPSLFFWYKIDKSSSSSYLNYTLLTIGSSPLSHKIYLSSLSRDGDWHMYRLPDSIVKKWRNHGGKLAGIEIRLIAGEEGAENTIYIDDLGYSFMSVDSDRTSWVVNNFYNFTNGELTGRWRLDVIASDGSDYRITKSIFMEVLPSADLEVYKIDFPNGLKEGEMGRFIVYVRNNGPKSINDSTPINVSLTLYQDALKPIKLKKSIAGLGKGESKQVYFEWTASYGNASYDGIWNVIAKVNEENTIDEWNSMNNWLAKKIKIEPRPDMEIEMDDVAFSPMHPLNEKVNITTIVHNIGYKEGKARVKIYEKEEGERRYILISNASLQKTIGGKSWERFSLQWDAPSNGTYNIKIVVECEDELNTANNIVIKDLKVGGGVDTNKPHILNARLNKKTICMGEEFTITATIFDDETSIDKAIVYIGNESEETEIVMHRIDETDVYYVNLTLNKIGEYWFYVKAWDTANIQNENESKKEYFRTIYEGIETNPPNITGITYPSKQVIDEPVNISAYIDDESNILHAYIHIIHNGIEEKEEMEHKNGSKIYYYSRKYGVGNYAFYIEAIDNSANRNRNTTPKYFFEIPPDYDGDGVPDEIEANIGGDPKNRNDTINVSVDKWIGYLIFVQKDNKYIYWSKIDNKTRDTSSKDVNGDGYLDILFDANGDGVYDHYYNKHDGSINVYEETENEEGNEMIWILPPSILFIIIGLIFIILRRRY